MRLPKVKDRVCLTQGIELDEGSYKEEAEDWEQGLTDVTVLAQDRDEGIWTVWDHTDRCLKMISFDENGNWRWVEATPGVTDDQT